MTGLMQFTYDAGHEIMTGSDTEVLLERILFLYARYMNIEKGFISVYSPYLKQGAFEVYYGHSGQKHESSDGDIRSISFPEILFIDGGAVRIRVPVTPDSESGVIFVFELAREDHRGNEVMSYIISVTVMIGHALLMKALAPVKGYETAAGAGNKDPGSIPLDSYIGSIERDIILKYLKETRGNITRAAGKLGVTKRVLNYKIKNMSINYKAFKE